MVEGPAASNRPGNDWKCRSQAPPPTLMNRICISTRPLPPHTCETHCLAILCNGLTLLLTILGLGYGQPTSVEHFVDGRPWGSVDRCDPISIAQSPEVGVRANPISQRRQPRLRGLGPLGTKYWSHSSNAGLCKSRLLTRSPRWLGLSCLYLSRSCVFIVQTPALLWGARAASALGIEVVSVTCAFKSPSPRVFLRRWRRQPAG